MIRILLLVAFLVPVGAHAQTGFTLEVWSPDFEMLPDGMRVEFARGGERAAYKLDKQGKAEVELSGGVDYSVRVHVPGAEPTPAGSFRVPADMTSGSKLEMVLTMLESGELASYVGVRRDCDKESVHQSCSMRGQRVVFGAPTQAPARLGRDVPFATVRKTVLAAEEEVAIEASPPPSTEAPRVTKKDAMVFDIDGIAIDTAEEGPRRVWRALGNARTDEGRAAAHNTIADYWESKGQVERSELSREKARFWREAGL